MHDTDCTGIARLRATLSPHRGAGGPIGSYPVCCLDEAERISLIAEETGRFMTLSQNHGGRTVLDAAAL